MRAWEKREGAEDEVAAEDVSRDEAQQGGEQGGEAAASALNEAGRADPGHAGECSGLFVWVSTEYASKFFFSFCCPFAKRGNFVIFHFDSVQSVHFFCIFSFC